MSFLQHPAFLRLYHLLPHRLLNRSMGFISRARRPRFAVDAAIRAWVRRDAIDMRDFEAGPFSSLEEFFLRRLRPGARPIEGGEAGEGGVIAPVDGRVVAAGSINKSAILDVKGHPLSLDRLVNGRRHKISLDGLAGGAYLSTFLSPRGYHRVHMPEGGELVDVSFIPGRFFPQNEVALRHIDGVYERNERATIRIRTDGGDEIILVMVGASLVGGIEIAGVPRTAWVGPRPFPLHIAKRRGDEIGHFRFGSTVVLLLPPRLAQLSATVGDELFMGQTIVPVG